MFDGLGEVGVHGLGGEGEGKDGEEEEEWGAAHLIKIARGESVTVFGGVRGLPWVRMGRGEIGEIGRAGDQPRG